ncbi:MAG TPA: DegV family protein [Anaerolineales bacterium]|nr:DegV family protein [Anaerolineales bacterium]
MPASIAIVVDSTINLPPELVSKYHITVMPQVVIWGQETFLDGVDIKPNEFYERLRSSKITPKTSQVSIQAFHDAFVKLSKTHDAIVCIVLSSDLSGTLNSATQAKALLPDVNISIIDSRYVAMAMGYVVVAAAKAIEENKSLTEVVATAEQTIQHVGVMLTVDTLEYLHRGGRIGGAQKLIGNVLNINPILAVEGGKVVAGERIRTRKKAMEHLAQKVCAQLKGKTHISVTALHCDAKEDAQALLASIVELSGVKETYLTELSPVIGVHVGPGTIGLCWLAE